MSNSYNQSYLKLKRENSKIFPENKYIFKKSRLFRIFPRLFLSTSYCVAVSYLSSTHGKLALPPNTLSYVSVVMGLLLAFRTNTAYDRYWEGRKVWGAIEEISINLMRNLKYCVKSENEEHRKENLQALKNVVALSYAIRYYLLGKPDYVSQEMMQLISPKIKSDIHTLPYGSISGINSNASASANKYEYGSIGAPSSSTSLNSGSTRVFSTRDLNLHHRITYELAEYIECIPSSSIKPQAYAVMLASINQLSGACINCLRIQTTPMPVSYSSHLYQSLYLYLLFLPFSMLGYSHYVMGMIQFMVTFMLFGALDIAEEIEDPFGEDGNDLQLDKFCGNIYEEYKFTVSLSNHDQPQPPLSTPHQPPHPSFSQQSV